MPTPRKNRPSRMPRNGSMSASIWCRNVDSDNSTPARNAPIAIDSPPSCINRAAPSTTNKAAAVMTSRAPACASTRKNGLSNQRPAASRKTKQAAAMPIAFQRSAGGASMPAGAISATTASSGTINRSSNSRIETIFCPLGRVEVSAFGQQLHRPPRSKSARSRAAPMNATGNEQAKHADAQRKVRPAPQATICRCPGRIFPCAGSTRCEGRISRPMTNRNITTPSSATCRIACGSLNQPNPNGPIAASGGQIAEDRTQAKATKDRNGDDGRAQECDDADQLVGIGGSAHAVILA